MKKAMAWLVVVVLVLFAGAARAEEEQETRILLLRLKPAVVLILVNVSAQVEIKTEREVIQFQPDPETGVGSGFIINPNGYVVTNGHVVSMYHESNERSLEQKFLRMAIIKYLLPAEVQRAGRDLTQQEVSKKVDELYDRFRPDSRVIIKKDLKVFLSNGEDYPAEIKSFSPPLFATQGKVATAGGEVKRETGKDVAILKIEGKHLPTVKLCNECNVEMGERVYVIGFPGVVLGMPLSPKTMLDSTVTEGTVGGSKLDIRGTPVIQTNAAITGGNSGGPAFNSKGEVIGVATFTGAEQLSSGETIRVAGFNFLVAASTVKEFVRAAGVEIGNESLFNKLWFEAIDLYTKSEFKEALTKLDEVLRIVPNQPDARKLVVSAQEMLAKGGQRSWFSFGWIVSVIAGVVVIIALVIVVPMSRKRKPVPPVVAPTVMKAAPRMAGKLVGRDGIVAGQTFTIGQSGSIIGRDPAKSQIVVDNEEVSRQHAWVGLEGGIVMLKDLNSTNGTYLNTVHSEKVTRVPLKDGDVIIIGKGSSGSFIFKAAD